MNKNEKIEALVLALKNIITPLLEDDLPVLPPAYTLKKNTSRKETPKNNKK